MPAALRDFSGISATRQGFGEKPGAEQPQRVQLVMAFTHIHIYDVIYVYVYRYDMSMYSFVYAFVDLLLHMLYDSYRGAKPIW